MLKNFAARMRTLLRPLVWIEAIYPLILAGLMIAPLIYIMFSGQPHRRLSGLAERYFINTMLSIGQRSQAQPAPIAVFEPFTEDPLPPLEKRWEQLQDRLVLLIEHLLATNPSTIYVFLPELESSMDVPLARVLSQLQQTFPEASLVGVVPYERWSPTLRNQFAPAQLKFAQDCGGKVQTVCPFVPTTWNNWIGTTVTQQTIPSAEEVFSSRIIVNTLPTIHPSFLLNLAPPDQIPHIFWHEVLEQPARASTIEKGIAFVTLGSTQAQQQVVTTHGPVASHAEFWAQVAEMFYNHKGISVFPEWISWTVGAVLSTLIVAITLFSVPPIAGVVLYCTSLLVIPTIIVFLLVVPGIYIPTFPAIFLLTVTMLSCIFLRLSAESFTRLLREKQLALHRESAHMRANFTSLLSHNLNTPIAKMLGMVDILQQSSGSDEARTKLKMLARKIARLQLSIRSLLVTTAVRDQFAHIAPMTITALKSQIDDHLGGITRRLDLQTEFSIVASDEFLLHRSLQFDPKVLATTWAALAALFESEEQEAASIYFKVFLDEQKDGQGVKMTTLAESRSKPLPHSIARAMAQDLDQLQESDSSELDFMHLLLLRLIKSSAHLHAGQIRTFVASDGACHRVELVLHELGPLLKKYVL